MQAMYIRDSSIDSNGLQNGCWSLVQHNIPDLSELYTLKFFF